MVDDIPVRVRPEIAALAPYRQGKQAGADAFKLSSNENPFDPLPGVLEALQSASSVNRYPDALASRLRERLAARFGVSVDAVHIGAGSVSVLSQLILATAGPGDEVVYAWRSFEAYPGLVLIAGATPVQVPITADGRHDLAAMAAAVTIGPVGLFGVHTMTMRVRSETAAAMASRSCPPSARFGTCTLVAPATVTTPG